MGGIFRRRYAARAQVHLWDAFTGACRGAYVGRDHLDELAVAYSVAFSPSGSRLFCGGDRSVRVFDTARCGVDCAVRPTAPTRRSSSGVKGLIGAVACADDNVYAVGSYAGAVAVFDAREAPKAPALRVCKDKPLPGVTGLAFDAGGAALFAACRAERDAARASVRCFDVRTGKLRLRCLRGPTPSHQRIQFDVRGGVLVSGAHDGTPRLFDVRGAEEGAGDDAPEAAPVLALLPRTPDACNGAALHPHRALVALASGQRHYPAAHDASDSDAEVPPPAKTPRRAPPCVAVVPCPPEGAHPPT